ncbi:AarF/ABC1/UbiB kinase family protein [Persephonella atlantica]|uniref:AarF/ABC1/UbiB kinase family protein n=1 Tax=Persephonella atlantica TaxID=2699429 RepID=A0ABS1GIX4_9AQUI|nr:AarF/UbiB family protein [Persephonella atlantica]MBK3332831.1 AarF/ABC1/UbiB kinase family protein [Persephonella atlantica]
MFKKKIKLAKRFKDITFTLSKLGFHNIYDYFKLLFGLEVEPGAKPRRIREALEKLGPSFIKLGQVLSTRPDIVPVYIIDELIKLQDRAKPFDFSIVEEILRRNYGDRLEEIFSHIEPQPLASASISQVHVGYLKTGEKVAVKIRRPELHELIELDSELMLMIVDFLERHFKGVKEFNLKGVIHQFKRTTLQEADFSIEAQNIKIFQENFKDYPGFKIPRCFYDISTPEVLITEFVDGTKISEIDILKKKGLDPVDIARRLTDAYFKMVFVDGVYHADPHPGNLFVLDDGTIVAVDFGMIAFLSKTKKRYIFDYIIAVTTLDMNLAIQFYEGFNMFTPYTDFGNFESDLQFFLEKYHNKRLDEINLREMIEDIIGFIKENHLRLPADISYLGKAALNLEGTVRKLDPTFNPTERLKNFIGTSTKDYIFEKVYEVRDAFELFFYLIFKIEHIYRLLIRERVTFQIIFKDLEELQKFYREQVGKIAFALLFSGMLVSSALFYMAGKETTGFFLIIMSIFLGIISIYKILRF